MMKKNLFLLITLCACLNTKAEVYHNFMEGGRAAMKDANFPLANYLFEEALRQIPADSLEDIYLAKGMLHTVNRRMGNYPEAFRYGTEGIRILEKLGLSGTYYTLEDSLKVANICALRGDSALAAHYVDGVFVSLLRNNGSLSWKAKHKLSTLAGVVSTHIGNLAQAESSYDLSCKILLKKFQPCDETVTTLNLYGNILWLNNKYEEALNIYRRQLEMAEKVYGKDSRDYQWTQYCIANTLAFMGRIDEGSTVYMEVVRWYRDKMLNDLQSIPSTQRDVYLDDMISILQNAIPFGVEAKYNEDEFTSLAYECLLLTKGLLLATERSTEAIIREKGTPEEIAELTSLYRLKSQLTDLLANGGSNPEDVLNTYASIKTCDYNLAKACARYGNNTSFAAIGYDRVRRSLRPGEVLLDFADFKPKSKPRQYVCFEIRGDLNYPKVHYICNGAELDSLLALEKNQLGNLYDGEAGRDMARIIGAPLQKIIKDAATVYYVPSGIFHKLAIEAIPQGEKRLGDTYAFQRLSSARELTTDENNRQPLSAQLYGGLTYGKDLKPLSRSMKEVQEISTTLASVMKPQTLTGSAGTKESFMQLSGDAPELLHLSTHGYYFSPKDKQLPASLQGYNDAMTLSGLVMSSGSLASKLGLLTAHEVARCNLSGTSLACLASCHSGQGEVTAEGIYGLQRAFKKAGVKSVVMNLWKASDVATECFMTNFYKDLIHGSKDRHKAFRYARDQVRRQYPAPFYWAGFVMID